MVDDAIFSRATRPGGSDRDALPASPAWKESA